MWPSASVKLNLFDLRIGLEVDNTGRSAELSTSVFGTVAQLNQLLENNIQRCQPVANWKVWTWVDADITYKAWAEFGGVLPSPNGPEVLLRDKAGKEVRVPQQLLSSADVKFINDGRMWQSLNNQQLVLMTDPRTDPLEFAAPSTGQRKSLLGKPSKAEDQQWLLKLRNAYKVKPPTSNSAWQAFACSTAQ